MTLYKPIFLFFRPLFLFQVTDNPAFVFQKEGELEQHIVYYFGIAALIIFSLVVFFVVLFIFRYRQSESADEEPKQLHGDKRIEVGSLILVAGVVGTFLVFTVRDIYRIQDIPENPSPDVIITGHQWWWEAYYPQSGVVTANEIHIPTGKKMLLQLESADVVHSWWVPQLGRKMDMLPGIKNFMYTQAGKESEYTGACSEFCGAQHAHMRVRLISQNQSDFEAWQQSQLKEAGIPEDPEAVKGMQLFQSKTCGNCHHINGLNEPKAIGPDLTHLAGRKMLFSDYKPNTIDNLKAWLKNPQHVKPGARMPNFILNDDEVSQLTAYLNQLN